MPNTVTLDDGVGCQTLWWLGIGSQRLIAFLLMAFGLGQQRVWCPAKISETNVAVKVECIFYIFIYIKFTFTQL